MKKFIGKKISFIFTFVFLLAMFSNSALANSSEFSCTMNHRYVNGKDNDELHGLDKGTMYIKGTVRLIDKDTGANPSPSTITIQVYEDKAIDRFVGSFTVKPNSDGYASFHKEFTKGVQPSGTYFIVMYTTNDDGWNVKCSGTLYTKK